MWLWLHNGYYFPASVTVFPTCCIEQAYQYICCFKWDNDLLIDEYLKFLFLMSYFVRVFQWYYMNNKYTSLLFLKDMTIKMFWGVNCLKTFIKKVIEILFIEYMVEFIFTMKIKITLTPIVLWLKKSLLPQLLSRSLRFKCLNVNFILFRVIFRIIFKFEITKAKPIFPTHWITGRHFSVA